MDRVINGFAFRCPGCMKEQTAEGEYTEKKTYTCSACKWQGMVPKKNKMYNVKFHPFTFLCPHCNKVQRTYEDDFKGEIDGYYITECDCPGCKKHLVFKTETPTHYFINQLKQREE